MQSSTTQSVTNPTKAQAVNKNDHEVCTKCCQEELADIKKELAIQKKINQDYAERIKALEKLLNKDHHLHQHPRNHRLHQPLLNHRLNQKLQN